MPTRSKYLFITPTEFVAWLPAAAAALGVHIVLDHIPRQPLVYWDGVPENLLAAWRVYLAPEKIELKKISPKDLIPQEYGWIDVDVPKVQGRYLEKATAGVKSDWFVSVDVPYRENPEALKLFERFWRKWKPHFRYGLVSRNIKTGAKGFDRGVGYTPGAAEWARGGGILTAEFGANGEFTLPD